MKAAVLHATGPPSVFSIEDVDQPAPGPDEVLVKVSACGVSGHDVAVRSGSYRRGITFPHISGIEISGEVVEVGQTVEHVALGDQVCTKPWRSCGLCRFCRNGMETSCVRRESAGDGGYAEFVCLPSEVVVPVPLSIPPSTACTLGAAAGVALNAVRDTARVQLGDVVLVTGASGGVGLPAVQLARLSGARVIAETRSVERIDFLKSAGAHEVVIAEGDRWFEDVLSLTEGKGVDAVIDTVGSKVFVPAFRSLRAYGAYASVGQLDGEEVPLNLARIFFKRARLLGVGSVTRHQLEDVARLTSDGLLAHHIGRIVPLEEVGNAHRMVESGEILGRIIVSPIAVE